MHHLNKLFYKELIRSGLSPSEIDKGDIFYLLDLFFGKDESQEKQEAIVYANQVPWL